MCAENYSLKFRFFVLDTFEKIESLHFSATAFFGIALIEVNHEELNSILWLWNFPPFRMRLVKLILVLVFALVLFLVLVLVIVLLLFLLTVSLLFSLLFFQI